MTESIEPCTRCILPANYPHIRFDSEGVCCYCWFYERRWGKDRPKKTDEDLIRILTRTNPKYAALVGLSGGKDSCYLLHLIVRRYKLPVLAYTIDNGFFSDGARENMELMVGILGVEHRFRFVFPPEYIEWDGEAIKQTLRDEYGWVDHGAGKVHFDCVANDAANYFMNRRLGVSKVVERLSQLVRSGFITRDEALKRVDYEDLTEEPTESVNAVCQRLGMTREDLRPLLDGTAPDYRSFKGYARVSQRLRGLIWLSSKLGFTTEPLYQLPAGKGWPRIPCVLTTEGVQSLSYT